MPIDTANKRRSVSGYISFPIYPVADAVIDAADREHSLWLYSGIPASAPPPVTDGNICGDLTLIITPTSILLVFPTVDGIIDTLISTSVTEIDIPASILSITSIVGSVQECED